MASVLRTLSGVNPSIVPPRLKGKTLFETIRHLPDQGVGRLVRMTQWKRGSLAHTVIRISKVDLSQDPLGSGIAKGKKYWMSYTGVKPLEKKTRVIANANTGNWTLVEEPVADWITSRKILNSIVEYSDAGDKKAVKAAANLIGKDELLNNAFISESLESVLNDVSTEPLKA